MKKFEPLILFFLAILAFFSRAPLIEKYQSHWDGPQYTIAVVRFSYEQFTPTPPGYPLYIGLGKFFYFFFHNPHIAILWASVIGSVIGTISFFIVGKKIFNDLVGLISAFIYLTGSTFYYFGLTPYGFSLLSGVEVLLAYSVYRIFIQKKKGGVFFGIILGVWFGIRPQELFQMFPLVLLGYLHLKNKERIKSSLLALFLTLCWILPIIFSMGIVKFITFSYSDLVISIFGNSIKTHIVLMIKDFLLSFGIASIFLFYYIWILYKKNDIWKKHKKLLTFFIIWFLPGFLYNLLIRTEHAGYQMSYLLCFNLLISYAIWKSTHKHKILLTLVILSTSLFNLYWFFFNRDPAYTKPYRPTSFHYSDIRKNDIRTGSKVRFVEVKFNPKNTLLIATEAMWRPYSYYLTKFHLVALNALNNIDIPYIYHRYDATGWNSTWFMTKNFRLDVPKNATTIILMDDEARTWVKNYPFKVYNLAANASVTVFSVHPGDIIAYNYHSIKVIKHS